MTLLISSIGVVSFAEDKSVGTVKYDSIDNTQVTAGQAATLILNYVDDMLADKAASDSNHSKISLTKTLTIDYSSIDSAMDSVADLSGAINSLKFLLGDLSNLNLSALIKSSSLFGGTTAYKRSDGDLLLIKQLLQFISDNKTIVAKFVSGTLNVGGLANMISAVKNALAMDIPAMLKGAFYDNVVNAGGIFGDAKYADSAYKSYNFDQLCDLWAQTALTTKKYSYTAKNNSVILPSVTDAKTITVAKSLYALAIELAPQIYKDTLLQPINSDLKYYLGKMCGVKYNEVAAADVTAELKAACPYTSNFMNSTDYFKYNGDYYYRKDSTFYKADVSAVNTLYPLFNFDYDMSNFTCDASNGFLAQANTLVYSLMKHALSDSAFTTLTGYGFADGDNTKLDGNLSALIKLVLPNCPASFFYTGFDMTTISADKVKNMSLDQMLTLILTAVFNGSFDDIVVPANAEYPAEVAVLGLRKFMAQVTPYLNYDTEIFANDGTTIDCNTFKSEDKSYWTNLAETMGIDLAVYYLDNITNFNLDAEQVLKYKAAGWTWKDFLDEIVNWAFDYSGDLFKTYTSGLTFTRGKNDGGAFKKLDALLNALVNWSFVTDYDDNADTISTESLFLGGTDKKGVVHAGLVADLFDFDFADIIAVFQKNSNANNVFNMPLSEGVLKVVEHLLDGLIPGAVTDAEITGTAAANNYLDNFISKSNLGSLVTTLLGSLNTAKDNLLGSDSSTGGLLPVIVENLNNFGASQVYRTPTFGDSNTSVKWSGSYSFDVTNRASGLASAYEGKADSLWTVEVKGVTATSSDNAKLTVDNTKFNLTNKQSKTVTVSGSPANAIVKIVVTYNVKGPDGQEMSATDLTATKYIFASSADFTAPTSAEGKALGDLIGRETNYNRQSSWYASANYAAYTTALENAIKTYYTAGTYADATAALNTAVSGLGTSTAASTVSASLTAITKKDDLRYDWFDFLLFEWNKFVGNRNTAEDMVAKVNDADYGNDYDAASYAYTNYMLNLTFNRMYKHVRTGGINNTPLEYAVRWASGATVAAGANADDVAAFNTALTEAKRVAALGNDKSKVSQRAIYSAEENLMSAYKKLASAGAITNYGKAEIITTTAATTATTATKATTASTTKTPTTASRTTSKVTTTKTATTAVRTTKQNTTATPTTSASTTEQTPSIMLGDLDLDGKVTAADARLVLRRAVNLDPTTANEKIAADVDKDGTVTAADARLVLRYAVSLDSAWPSK